MIESYYGATRVAENEVSDLLGLPDIREQQDWEIIYADPSKVRQMLEILSQNALNVDSKSALCLLMIASFEKASDEGNEDQELISRAAKLIAEDPIVHARMSFYWLNLGLSHHPNLAKRILAPV